VQREIDWAKVLGLSATVGRVKQGGGWTGEDLKAHTTFLKEHRLQELNRFAGGELTKLEGSSLYPLMLEATALRYVLGDVRQEVVA